MKFSTLKEIQTNTSVTDTFSGYYHHIRNSDGQFYDMKNLCSDEYPTMSVRPKRSLFNYPVQIRIPGGFNANGQVQYYDTHDIKGLIAKDELIYIDRSNLVIGDHISSNIPIAPFDKDIVSFGSYIIIIPDGVIESNLNTLYVNTNDEGDWGYLDEEVDIHTSASYTMCRLDGTTFGNPTVSSTKPSNPSNGDYWIDTSDEVHTLKQYSSQSDSWVSIATTYVKIASKNIADGFNKYDAVYIDGNLGVEQLKGLEGNVSILYDVYHDTENNGNGDYVIVVGFLDEACQIFNMQFSLHRRVPLMDLMTESGNRLWGCRYGTDIDGNQVNEIYASKLGDFKNWESYMGISSDSYRVSCGNDGDWTGAITYNGNPIFFKENYMYKIVGDYPSNYQVQVIECKGVMKGAARSLVNLNGRLYYKSRDGICVYDGSLPTEITQPFGGIKYSATESYGNPHKSGAVAGVVGEKYYISMKSEVDGKWNLFVYDSQNGMWHKEDNTKVTHFATYKGKLHFVNSDIYIVNGSGTPESGNVKWMAETGIIGTSVKEGRYTTALPGKKYISKLLVRMTMALGARAMFYIQYDSQSDWEHIATLVGTSLRSFNVPIKPKRCDHFRLLIEGEGEVKIYSITKTIEKGSDV